MSAKQRIVSLFKLGISKVYEIIISSTCLVIVFHGQTKRRDPKTNPVRRDNVKSR